MRKILITGGLGFIGYHLAKKLASKKENNIYLIDNVSRGKLDKDIKVLCKMKNVTLLKKDCTKMSSFMKLDKDFDTIYHLAAVIGVRNVMERPVDVLSVNTLATINILEFARLNKKLKRIFLASTSEAYSGTFEHFKGAIPTPETIPLTLCDLKRSRTSYALSKIYSESLFHMYHHSFGVPITIGRYHNVYGPRMGFDHVIPEMFQKIKRNKVIDVASPKHTRAFCHISDAVEMTLRLTRSKSALGETFNIGNSQEEIQIKKLVERIISHMGENRTIRLKPDTPGSPLRRCPDISKIIKATKYRPKVTLDKGITNTYQWYKDKIGDGASNN